MNTKKTANFEPAITLSKDTFTHEGVQYHTESRRAKRGETILTTKTIGHYKKGQVYEVSDYTGKEAWCKNGEGFPIPIRHAEYVVLVPMVEAQPLPTSVYSPSMLNQLEASGTPIFNEYHHTVLDFSEVDRGHTLVMKLPAGDYITVCGMVMTDKVNAIVDIQYHGDNGQQMIGFTGDETPQVRDSRSKHKLYSLDIRPDHKDKPYGDTLTLAFRRVDEVIIDISMNVGSWMSKNTDSLPDGYDSRVLNRAIHEWAVEFEKEFGIEARDDYYDRVDSFSEKKISQWVQEYTE